MKFDNTHEHSHNHQNDHDDDTTRSDRRGVGRKARHPRRGGPSSQHGRRLDRASIDGPGFAGPDPLGGDFDPVSRRGRRGPGRGRRGDVRAAIIAILAEQPMNGYGLISAIAHKSEGLWKPGAGSVYPALGLLEDEGLIAPTELDGKKVHELTDAGHAYAAEHPEETTAPWDRVAEPHRGYLDLRPDLKRLRMALHQVVMTGDQPQIQAARAVLDTACKDIYRLLAGDTPTD